MGCCSHRARSATLRSAVLVGTPWLTLRVAAFHAVLAFCLRSGESGHGRIGRPTALAMGSASSTVAALTRSRGLPPPESLPGCFALPLPPLSELVADFLGMPPSTCQPFNRHLGSWSVTQRRAQALSFHRGTQTVPGYIVNMIFMHKNISY